MCQTQNAVKANVSVEVLTVAIQLLLAPRSKLEGIFCVAKKPINRCQPVTELLQDSTIVMIVPLTLCAVFLVRDVVRAEHVIDHGQSEAASSGDHRSTLWFGNTKDDCFCVPPAEQELCRRGGFELCKSLLCFDSQALCDTFQIEKKLLLTGCYAFFELSEKLNCGQDPFEPPTGGSKRPGAKDCYGGRGIRTGNIGRDNCDAGSCCRATNLCPIERAMHFMMLAYGIAVDEEDCSALDVYGGDSADCSYVTDGISNEALVCSSATVTDESGRYCDISFAATNDIVDVFREAQHYFFSDYGKKVSFAGADGEEYSFFALAGLVDVAMGSESNPLDGIVEIAFQTLGEKGCFTRSNPAVHVIGHSLGGFLANVLALKIGAEFPSVEVRLTTAGEPFVLLEPLRGAAADLPVWQDKVNYVAGTVLPRGDALEGLGLRSYGIYQSYDPIPQIIPTGLTFEGDTTDTVVFVCEVLLKNNQLSYFLAGPEGCASLAGRDDVRNDQPSIPHRGTQQDDTLWWSGLVFGALVGLGIDDDIISMLSIMLAALDDNLRDDVLLVFDTHQSRRYFQFFNLLTANGSDCAAVRRDFDPIPDTCPVT